MWLNYRKKKSWDILISEIINTKIKYQTSGIHIDDGQEMPPIFKSDDLELNRKDYEG